MKFSLRDLFRWTLIAAIAIDAGLRFPKVINFDDNGSEWHSLFFWGEVTIAILLAISPSFRRSRT